MTSATHSQAPNRRGQSKSPGGTALCPLDLRVDTIARFLNFEIADHPFYDGLELQWFDDDIHGTGMLAFLSRRQDRRIDFYVQDGLRLDQSAFRIGAGIAGWTETTFEVARLVVDVDGVAAQVRFLDRAGRRIEVRVDDRDGRRRDRGAVLAPVSAGIDAPTSLLLVWMTRFDLLRMTGRPPELLIDGETVATGKLPGARWHRRHLVKYASELVTVTLNERRDGPVRSVDPASPEGVHLVGPRCATAAVTGRAGAHHARLELEPPMPDPSTLRDGEHRRGSWRITVDESQITGGTWSAVRRCDVVDLELDVTERWRPGRLPLLMRVVTTAIPTFRGWPPTYRWSATVRLGDPPTMASAWHRKPGQRGELYRRLTRSGSD